MEIRRRRGKLLAFNLSVKYLLESQGKVMVICNGYPSYLMDYLHNEKIRVNVEEVKESHMGKKITNGYILTKINKK